MSSENDDEFFFPQESPCQTHDLRAPTQQCEGSHWAKKWDGCGTGWWPVMFFYGGENGIYLEIIAKGTESRKWRGGKNNSNIDNPSNKVIFPFRSTPFKLQVFFYIMFLQKQKKTGFHHTKLPRDNSTSLPFQSPLGVGRWYPKRYQDQWSQSDSNPKRNGHLRLKVGHCWWSHLSKIEKKQ